MTIIQADKYMKTCKADYTPQSLVETAFHALGCGQNAPHYVAVAGTAGKTCVATLTDNILRAARLSTGCYLGGVMPLRGRILVGGQAVPAKLYTAAVAAVQKQAEDPAFVAAAAAVFAAAPTLAFDSAEPLDEDTRVAAEFGFAPMPVLQPLAEGLSATAAEFLVAAHCFAKAGCQFAVVELPDPSYAAFLPFMPAAALVQLGVDDAGHSALHAAKTAGAIFRADTVVVSSPTQPADVLREIVAQSKQVGCIFTVPDLEDFTPKKHRRLQNRMDYGGYEVMLPYLGEHSAHNAAIAIELALAIWRKGFDISDEAILEGLSLAENRGNILPLQYTPLVLVDSCHNPVQAAAFAQWVKAEDYQAVSLILGFAGAEHFDAFLSALETGTVVDPDTLEKAQLPGMSDNAFDKVYAVTLDVADALTAQEIVAQGKFHFDIQPCNSLAEAVAMASADANDGIMVCGHPILAFQDKLLVP